MQRTEQMEQKRKDKSLRRRAFKLLPSWIQSFSRRNMSTTVERVGASAVATNNEQPNKNVWIGELDDQGQCQGVGTVFMENGDVYTGSMKNGKMSGIGQYKWVDGQVYQGEYVDGVENGKGKATYPSGNTYVGDFLDRHFHGKGHFVWSNGQTYRGEWQNN